MFHKKSDCVENSCKKTSRKKFQKFTHFFGFSVVTIEPIWIGRIEDEFHHTGETETEREVANCLTTQTKCNSWSIALAKDKLTFRVLQDKSHTVLGKQKLHSMWNKIWYQVSICNRLGKLS